MLTNPTAYGTSYDWLHRLVTSLVLRGNAYGLVVSRTPTGIPTQIEWLDPDEVSIQDNRSIAPPVWYYQGRIIDNDDFVHIPWFTVPGFIKGLSPVGAYQTTLSTGIHAQNYGNEWFQNGSIPSGLLQTEHPVTQEQATLIKSRFKKAAKGRDVAVLGLGVSFKPITVMPEEAQFLGTIKATANQIAAIYGVPPTRIGGSMDHSMTYQNAEQESIRFVTDCLMPYLTKIEMALSALLPRGQCVKFNLDALLRADTLTRYQAHHYALTGRWKNRDEIREIEDLPPLPNGEGESFDVQLTSTNPPGPPGADTNLPQGGSP